jgi:hypothetical protein
MVDPGRPTLYRPDYCELARNYCLLGATNEDLAGFFEVAPRTIDNWIAAHPDFAAAVREARVVADARVARCLYERAVGYEHKVTRTVLHQGREHTLTDTVHLPPDTRACIFWLRNRQRRLWSDRSGPAPNDDPWGGGYDPIAELDAAGERAHQESLKERSRDPVTAARGPRGGSGLLVLQRQAHGEPARADEDQVDAEEDAERVGAGVGPLGHDHQAEQQRDQR